MIRAARLALPALLFILLLLLCHCGERRVDAPATATTSDPPARVAAPAAGSIDASPPVKDLAADAILALPIPARAQAPESPPSGWCGETAIQEGLLHLGVWAPQRLINRAGRPVHPDLYATDIPVALDGLGVRYSLYAARERGFEPYARWVRGALAEGDPVIAGVKILPTAHPDWGLDHFVLVMGHGPKGLLVNTTWGTREWVGDTTTPGLSLKNAFYGIRLHGLRLPSRAIAARLALVEEDARSAKVRISCASAQPGAAYRIERRTHSSETKPASSVEVSGPQSTEQVLDADRPARFQCVPL